jgi:hypothetical protein
MRVYALKGHDFSRAVTGTKSLAASAAEGDFPQLRNFPFWHSAPLAPEANAETCR